MEKEGGYRTVLGFLLGYLLLSWPPFLYLNREVLPEVVEQLTVVDPLVAVWVLGAVFVLLGLVRVREGVERYNQFLAAPSNLVAILVVLSFLVAAVSWWALPEIVFYFELGLTLNQVLVLIFVCQAPMLILLSLMAALGKAVSPE
ncbi:hypothetical protein ACFQJ7_14440 [Halovenus rubra]|uniref:Uncharacterized protein n=2 Tax=Halovenus rubra TaxID=869890 RepID=A0ABD5XDR5_9EURY|nr:hypothetical protein [Halovenus rubra]